MSVSILVRYRIALYYPRWGPIMILNLIYASYVISVALWGAGAVVGLIEESILPGWNLYTLFAFGQMSLCSLPIYFAL